VFTGELIHDLLARKNIDWLVDLRSCCTTHFRPNRINNLARLCNTL
jgi:hypothetical protein